jgi:hypothetical protein
MESWSFAFISDAFGGIHRSPYVSLERAGRRQHLIEHDLQMTVFALEHIHLLAATRRPIRQDGIAAHTACPPPEICHPLVQLGDHCSVLLSNLLATGYMHEKT